MVSRNILSTGLIVALFLVISACQSNQEDLIDDEIVDQTHEKLEIEGVGTFWYDPAEVETVRSDIFREGHFSVFAILMHLAKNDDFKINYYFDETMNTYVIEDINGIENWWYTAYYDGGWQERNVYRMDHFLFKENMTIRLFQEDELLLEDIYQTYKDEIIRLNDSDGRIVIPEIIIDGSTTSYTFYDIEITAHNLRNDIYQDGVITAIDVIKTLGDMEKITYQLQWFDSIGRAQIVRSYWVYAINNDVQTGTTGFVYEAGAWDYYLFRGNHIHIPSDTRVINSPEYVRFFWIGRFEAD